MKIKQYLSFFLIIMVILGLGFLILTYNQAFHFQKLFVQINLKYLYALIASALLITTATFMAQKTLTNKMIDASFMGMGPIGSFVILTLLSLFASEYFQRNANNILINFVLPFLIGLSIALVGVGLIWLVWWKRLSTKQVVTFLIIINALLLTVAVIYMNRMTLSQKEYVSTFILASIKQITTLQFEIAMLVWGLGTLFYLGFLHKQSHIISLLSYDAAKALGIKVFTVKSFSLLLVGLMLGYGVVIGGNLSFLGLSALYLSTLFSRKYLWINLSLGCLLALVINFVTFFIFSSFLGALSKFPFGAIINLFGGFIFILFNFTSWTKERHGS